MRDPLDLLADNTQPFIIWFSIIIDLVWSVNVAHGIDFLAMIAVSIPSVIAAGICLVLLMIPAFILSTIQGLRH
jgi:hypothetical protein